MDSVNCPVCGSFLPRSEIELHVQLHFADDEPAGADRQETIVIDGDDEEDSRIQCPYGCGVLLALHELDSHEEAHRLQEIEAQQFALQEQDADKEHEQLQMLYGFTDRRPGKCFHCGEEGHWSRECPKKAGAPARPQQPLPIIPSQLSKVQQRDANAELHSVDVIPLLQACFEAQPEAHSIVYLSGPAGFHSGKQQIDDGWGCGYRNIQMQVSHQLMRGDPAVKQALFGGCGFVPDVASLQAWLEAAWAAGFDPAGAAMFGQQVQCSRKWIGTTEAAALLRYFGCRALLVEFLGKQPAMSEDASGATIHTGVQCDLCNQVPMLGIRYKSYQTPNYDVCSRCRESADAQQHAPFRAFGRSGRASAPSREASRAAAPAANGSNGKSGSKQQQPGIRQFFSQAKDSTGQQEEHQQLKSAAAAGMAGSCAAGSSKTWHGSNQVATAAVAAGGHGQGQGQRPDMERHRKLAEWIWTYFSTGSTALAQQQQQQQQQQRDRPPGWLSMDDPVEAAEAAAAAAAAASVGEGVSRHVEAAPAAPGAVVVDGWQKVPRRSSPVVLTGKPPLYLQHEGHSRTVVGIERCLSPQAEARAGSAAAEYSLIVLDPGIPAQELLTALRTKQGWQKQVKRGLSSLAKKAEYQVLHIVPGLVLEGPARDSLKRVAAEDRY